MLFNGIDIKKDVTERFIKYAKINTQAEDGSEKVPSTKCQHDLAKILFDELKSFGIKDVEYDTNHCYIYAKIPSNRSYKSSSGIAPVAFIAHMDTSPESSGSGVKPVIHKNYDGKVIKYPKNPKLSLSPQESPQLLEEKGHDIITSDGTTLLGADDKAGVAEIMTAAKILSAKNCDIEHGDIYIVFTPDEEVGNGTAHFNLKKCPAKFAYTLDGEEAGELNCETFNARAAFIEFHGVNTHPGTAHNRMKNTIYALADFINKIPGSMRPETTKNRTGFFHPLRVEADVECSKVKMIIRDFDEKKMDEKCEKLKQIVKKVEAAHGGIKIDLKITEQYQNMGVIIKKHPKLLKLTEEAVRLAGLKPFYRAIRGGTDGARLTFMGLPTLNLFAGMFNPHSKNEWASTRIMQYAVLTILNISTLA